MQKDFNTFQQNIGVEFNDLQLLRLNLRQIRLLGQERDLYLNLATPLQPEEPGWVLPRQDFTETRDLVLGSYHAAGGAGVAGAALIQPEQNLATLPGGLRSRLFAWLQDSKEAPAQCRGLIARELPPKKTKAAKPRRAKPKTKPQTKQAQGV